MIGPPRDTTGQFPLAADLPLACLPSVLGCSLERVDLPTVQRPATEDPGRAILSRDAKARFADLPTVITIEA